MGMGMGGGYGAGNGAGGRGRMDSAASIRSSPSHEPVHLPIPPQLRSRALRKRERSINLRMTQGGTVRGPKGGGTKGDGTRKPPPRVESTQPRETSPELSSGEETAGELDSKAAPSERYGRTPSVSAERIDNAWGAEDSTLSEPEDFEEGEWVDEEDDLAMTGGIDGEEDEMLQLEYHPSYVSNLDKRRRRWKTRWEGLVRAVRAHFILFRFSSTHILIFTLACSSKLLTEKQTPHSSFSPLHHTTTPSTPCHPAPSVAHPTPSPARPKCPRSALPSLISPPNVKPLVPR